MEMSSKDKHVNNWKFVSNCRFLIWFRKALHTPQSLSQLPWDSLLEFLQQSWRDSNTCWALGRGVSKAVEPPPFKYNCPLGSSQSYWAAVLSACQPNATGWQHGKQECLKVTTAFTQVLHCSTVTFNHRGVRVAWNESYFKIIHHNFLLIACSSVNRRFESQVNEAHQRCPHKNYSFYDITLS